MKNAVIITGAQSTGNHLMTRILVDSGFIGTVDGNQPFWDDVILGDGGVPDPIYTEDSDKWFVFRGSMPKGGPGWWAIDTAVERLTAYGYLSTVIVMHRDVFATASSQVYKYADSIPTFETAVDEIRLAYKHIYDRLLVGGICRVVPVTYESLVFQKRETLLGLTILLGRPVFSDVDITNENAKWYGGQNDPNVYP